MNKKSSTIKRLYKLAAIFLCTLALAAIVFAATRPPETIVITTTIYPHSEPSQDWGEYISWPSYGRLAEL